MRMIAQICRGSSYSPNLYHREDYIELALLHTYSVLQSRRYNTFHPKKTLGWRRQVPSVDGHNFFSWYFTTHQHQHQHRPRSINSIQLSGRYRQALPLSFLDGECALKDPSAIKDFSHNCISFFQHFSIGIRSNSPLWSPAYITRRNPRRCTGSSACQKTPLETCSNGKGSICPRPTLSRRSSRNKRALPQDPGNPRDWSDHQFFF